jgi:excisionase family DNA binding protein
MQSAHTWRKNASNDQPDLLTTEQVAELLQTSDRTIIRWRNERIGPPWCKLGRQVRYRRQSLEQWLADSEQQPVRGVA